MKQASYIFLADKAIVQFHIARTDVFTDGQTLLSTIMMDVLCGFLWGLAVF